MVNIGNKMWPLGINLIEKNTISGVPLSQGLNHLVKKKKKKTEMTGKSLKRCKMNNMQID